MGVMHTKAGILRDKEAQMKPMGHLITWISPSRWGIKRAIAPRSLELPFLSSLEQDCTTWALELPECAGNICAMNRVHGGLNSMERAVDSRIMDLLGSGDPVS